MKRTEKTGFQKKQTEPMGDVQIQEFLDMIAPAVIKFETDHFICGNTYRCVWALREYPTATEEQANPVPSGREGWGNTSHLYPPCHSGGGTEDHQQCSQ